MNISQKYSLTEEKKKEYAGIFVLEYMINRPKTFPLFLEGNDQDLEPILEWLMTQGYVEMHKQEKYIPTNAGRKVIESFIARYSEYLNVFDVYCAIDLEQGEYAFSSYSDFDDTAKWREYLNQHRWEDMRIAVAEYKGMDPIEIVFMSFISEGRFGRNTLGWQFDLLLGSVWDEIIEICNSSIHWKQLAYTDENGEVEAESVIEHIISGGVDLIIALHEKKAVLNHAITQAADDEEDHYVERVACEAHERDHYHPYKDPFYVSPLFLTLLIL